MALCATATSAATASTAIAKANAIATSKPSQLHFRTITYSSLKPHSNPTSSSIKAEPAASSWRKTLEMGMIGAMAASVVLGFSSSADATRIEYYATVSDPSCEFNVVRSGLAYCDIVPGYGVAAPYNELINVHYTARFADETVFDSSYKRGRPLTMRIGVGKVIKGLDQGIFGGDGVPPMQVGGKRKLRIPPELAYGPEPAGCFSGDCNIPANATLIYDVNFVGVYSGNRK